LAIINITNVYIVFYAKLIYEYLYYDVFVRAILYLKIQNSSSNVCL